MEEKIKKKFPKQFSKTKSNEFQTQLLELYADLINVTEGSWDYNSIRYDTVMTKKEWEEFVTHPERTPYKSKLGFSNDPKIIVDVSFELIETTLPYYDSLKKSEYKEKLKASIGGLIDCALHAKYDIEGLRDADIYTGRTTTQRDDGEIDPTPVTLAKLNYAIKEHCDFNNKDYEKTKKKIYNLCEGRMAILADYLYTCDIPLEDREELVDIFSIVGRDHTMSFAGIKLSWNIWKKIREIGIDTEKYLELMDLPKYSIVKKKLLEFQKDEDFVEEILKHMEDELPKSYKKYKQNGFIYRWELMHEEAQRKEYPKKLRSDEQINKMVEECKKEIYGYFPLAKKETPRNILFNPTHPSSTGRAFQSSVTNSKGTKVISIVMTPRVQLKDDYLPVLAHETAHALHRIVLEMGEIAEVLERGAGDRVPSTVMEDFSQLVEHPFHKDTELPYTKKYKGKEFPNYYSGAVTRAQVPFALTQLGIRKEFDKMWDSGHRDELTEKEIWEIRYNFGKKYYEWETLGIEVRPNGFPIRFSVLHPNDGLVYMKKYITETRAKVSSESKSTKTHKSMSTAFEEKYGKEWVKNKEARTMLHWLLLESGRNYKTEVFSKFILNKPVEECVEELEKIGIDTKTL